MSSFDQATSRRRFVQFMAASPLFAYGGFSAFAGEGPTAGTKLPDPIMWAPLRTEDLIKSPKDAINVFDFEPVMRHNVPPAHFGDMASGVDDEVTLRANREGFLKFQLRPRRLVDVSKVDMSTEILGVQIQHPDRHRAGGRAPALDSRRGDRCRARRRKSATICRFSPQSRPARWKMSPPRARRADLVPTLRDE